MYPGEVVPNGVVCHSGQEPVLTEPELYAPGTAEILARPSFVAMFGREDME